MEATTLKKSFLFFRYIINYFQDMISVYHTSVLELSTLVGVKSLDGRLLKVFNRCRSKKEPPSATRVRHLIKTPRKRGCNKRLTSSKAIHQKTQPKCQRKKYRNVVCVLKRGRSNYPWVLGGQKTTRRFDITLNATPQRGTATPVFSTAGPTKGLLFMHELL